MGETGECEEGSLGMRSYPSWSESCMKSSSDMIAAPAWVSDGIGDGRGTVGYLDVRGKGWNSLCGGCEFGGE